jgi:hypothetical protein
MRSMYVGVAGWTCSVVKLGCAVGPAYDVSQRGEKPNLRDPRTFFFYVQSPKCANIMADRRSQRSFETNSEVCIHVPSFYKNSDKGTVQP